MRPICWLHISDIHIRIGDSWMQDVVLRAMCDSIARHRAAGTQFDFILVTGDIAFSGNPNEYRVAEGFFDALSSAAGVPRERIFSVPGNHDVDRNRQKVCFQGARLTLTSPNHVDIFLTPNEDLTTLMHRQESYSGFVKTYWAKQQRISTPDGLAYASSIEVNDIRLAIVGLNSAWLAEGGLSDHGKLLIGERQVIDALRAASALGPHITVAMAHHPLHLLQEFDRGPVSARIERECHFFHSGHLHEPEIRRVNQVGTDCLLVAAGASFETRQSHNSYSIVTLDLLRARRTIRTISYRHRSGAFDVPTSAEFPIDMTPASMCGLHELALALAAHSAPLAQRSHYLGALLLGAKSEIPIPAQDGYAFGSFAVMETQPDSDWKHLTIGFKAFGNALRVFYGRMPLQEIVSRHGGRIVEYSKMLDDAVAANTELRSRLCELERDAIALAIAANTRGQAYVVALLKNMCNNGEWTVLREQAERHLASSDPLVTVFARRMLALSLSHSAEATDRSTAINLYRELDAEGFAEPNDIANLAILCSESGRDEDAKGLLLHAIDRFHVNAAREFYRIGLRFVESRGDRGFRQRLEAALAMREKRG